MRCVQVDVACCRWRDSSLTFIVSESFAYLWKSKRKGAPGSCAVSLPTIHLVAHALSVDLHRVRHDLD